jgi:hypothetical protein
MVTIDLDVAGDLTANDVMTFRTTFADSYGLYCSTAGNVLPTPGDEAGTHDDLIVYQNTDAGSVFIHPGRDIPSGGGSATVTENPTDGLGCTGGVDNDCAEDALAVRLFQDAANENNSFGYLLTGGTDLTGDGIPDPVIGQPDRGSAAGGDGRSVWIFDGAKLAGAAGSTAHRVLTQETQVSDGLSFKGVNGWAIDASTSNAQFMVAVVGDFDGWLNDAGEPTPDLAIVNASKNAVAFHANHVDAAKGFELGLFPHIDGLFEQPNSAGVSNSIRTVSGGDITGDGRSDLFLPGYYGEVTIIH